MSRIQIPLGNLGSPVLAGSRRDLQLRPRYVLSAGTSLGRAATRATVIWPKSSTATVALMMGWFNYAIPPLAREITNR
jgi:hypothetical protein